MLRICTSSTKRLMFWSALVVSALPVPARANVSGVMHEYELANDEEVLKFTITLPENWDVKKDSGGFEFFAEPKDKIQPTAENPIVADPNVTVTASRNPTPIDELSLEPYAQQMIAGLQKSVGEEAGLEVFLKRVVDVNPARKGLLYYIRYKKGSFDVYNAVLVVSSAKHVFRVTLTDYQTTFDANLEKLYPFMSSIDVGPTQLVRPSLAEILMPWVSGFLALVVVFLGSRAVMQRLASSRLRDDLGESFDESRYSTHGFGRGAARESEREYDSAFRESSEASRLESSATMTEVPLSQAIAAHSRNTGSSGGRSLAGRSAHSQFLNHTATSGVRSVTDPETEVGDFSGAPIKSHAGAKSPKNSSVANGYPPNSEFGLTRAPDDDEA